MVLVTDQGRKESSKKLPKIIIEIIIKDLPYP